MILTMEERRAEALRLQVEEGLSVREIADRLGVSPGTAHRDVNPTAAARYRKAARKYKRRQRRQGER